MTSHTAGPLTATAVNGPDGVITLSTFTCVAGAVPIFPTVTVSMVCPACGLPEARCEIARSGSPAAATALVDTSNPAVPVAETSAAHAQHATATRIVRLTDI